MHFVDLQIVLAVTGFDGRLHSDVHFQVVCRRISDYRENKLREILLEKIERAAWNLKEIQRKEI